MTKPDPQGGLYRYYSRHKQDFYVFISRKDGFGCQWQKFEYLNKGYHYTGGVHDDMQELIAPKELLKWS